MSIICTTENLANFSWRLLRVLIFPYVVYNVLVFSSESPIMAGCHIDESNKSISTWSHLTSSDLNSLLHTLSVFFPLLLAWVCSGLTGRLVNLHVPVSLSFYLYLCVSVCKKSICLIPYKTWHWCGTEYIKQIFDRGLQGINSVAQTDPNWPR